MSLHSVVRQTTRFFLGLFLLTFASVLSVTAQSPTFANLMIELWPEYDRPETLVIYRAELSNGTSLPAEVTFRLPGTVDAPNAVAFEEDGRLFSVPPELIEQSQMDDALILTFSTNSPKIHLEYYDPEILTTMAQTRQLVFDFEAQYPIENATFQVQEPLQAENFQLTPPAASSFKNENGLTYHAFSAAGLAPGDTIHLQASYNRPISSPSAQQLPPSNETVSSVPEPTVNNNPATGYLLIGLGVVLLLAIGGYWWRSQQPRTPAREPAHVSKKRDNKSSPPIKKAAIAPEQAGFCTHCGAALPLQSNFCHVCGTQRRKT